MNSGTCHVISCHFKYTNWDNVEDAYEISIDKINNEYKRAERQARSSGINDTPTAHRREQSRHEPRRQQRVMMDAGYRDENEVEKTRERQDQEMRSHEKDYNREIQRNAQNARQQSQNMANTRQHEQYEDMYARQNVDRNSRQHREWQQHDEPSNAGRQQLQNYYESESPRRIQTMYEQQQEATQQHRRITETRDKQQYP